jgi:hypothetical protein
VAIHYDSLKPPIPLRATKTRAMARTEHSPAHLLRRWYRARIRPRWWLMIASASMCSCLGPAAAEVAHHPASPGINPTVSDYRLPVLGGTWIVHAFQPPATRYGPGHRGVDLAVSEGQLVVAAGAGQVTFAGSVAGRGVVVVRHADGIQTEYEPVAWLVGVGTLVRAGQALGRVAGVHVGCARQHCLHWGARRSGNYLDPLALLARLGPVRLLPWRTPVAVAVAVANRRSVRHRATPERLGGRSGSRMRPGVGLAQPFDRDMRVDLGAGEAGMAEKLLDRTQIGTAVEQVRGRGVPQPVRSEIRCASGLRLLMNDSPDGSDVDPTAPGAEQQGRSAACGPQHATRFAEPTIKRLAGRCAERDRALLGSFAEDPYQPTGLVDVIEVESYQLGHPDAGGVEHLDDQGVTDGQRLANEIFGGRLLEIVGCPTVLLPGRAGGRHCGWAGFVAMGRGEQGGDLGAGQHGGQRASTARTDQEQSSVVRGPPGGSCPAGERSRRGGPPGQGRAGGAGARLLRQPAAQGRKVKISHGSPAQRLQVGAQRRDVGDVRPDCVIGTSLFQA